eukprot:CAMPEP_0184520384 /NCGR_PEP_ID=MMETSP0198_2-20121128/7136_1 /TAXON_ID=1112570 /ORGANISM="Thraustochytrium sp., Strain LLF1b" /LENGTH=538 /DNA_ID=CAMNT_0026910973 /DNA_START=584 /DNA_END=2197 /DNA_ORIENTATION=+
MGLGTGRRRKRERDDDRENDRFEPRQEAQGKEDLIARAGRRELPSAELKEWKGVQRNAPKRRPWKKEEDDLLRHAVSVCKESQWKKIAEMVPGRTHEQCLQRWCASLNPSVVKGRWSKEEDKTLLQILSQKPIKNWGEVSRVLPGRTAKQCRERYINHLDPSICKTNWTPEEDTFILDAEKNFGPCWSEIARRLPTRTEPGVRQRFLWLQRNKAKNQSKGSKKDPEPDNKPLPIGSGLPQQEQASTVLSRGEPVHKINSLSSMSAERSKKMDEMSRIPRQAIYQQANDQKHDQQLQASGQEQVVRQPQVPLVHQSQYPYQYQGQHQYPHHTHLHQNVQHQVHWQHGQQHFQNTQHHYEQQHQQQYHPPYHQQQQQQQQDLQHQYQTSNPYDENHTQSLYSFQQGNFSSAWNNDQGHQHFQNSVPLQAYPEQARASQQRVPYQTHPYLPEQFAATYVQQQPIGSGGTNMSAPDNNFVDVKLNSPGLPSSSSQLMSNPKTSQQAVKHEATQERLRSAPSQDAPGQNPDKSHELPTEDDLW